MSDFEFERADRDVINMVRENRRRSGITRTVGVIVPLDEARKAEFAKQLGSVMKGATP